MIFTAAVAAASLRNVICMERKPRSSKHLSPTDKAQASFSTRRSRGRRFDGRFDDRSAARRMWRRRSRRALEVDAVSGGEADQRRGRPRAALPVDVRAVGINGLEAEAEIARDRLGPAPANDQMKDLPFTPREPFQKTALQPAGVVVAQARGQRRRQV